MPETGHPTLFALLRRLETAGIDFTIGRFRDDTVTVVIAVPGERWEVEVFSDGSIEVEVFRSDGEIRGGEALDALFDDPTT